MSYLDDHTRYELLYQSAIIRKATSFYEFCYEIEYLVDTQEENDEDFFETFVNGDYEVRIWSEEGHETHDIASFYTACYWVGHLRSIAFLQTFSHLGGVIPSIDSLYTTTEWEEDRRCVENILRVEYDDTMWSYIDKFKNQRVLYYPEHQDEVRWILDCDSIMRLRYPSMQVEVRPHEDGAEIWWAHGPRYLEMAEYLHTHGFRIEDAREGRFGSYTATVPFVPDKKKFQEFQLLDEQDLIVYSGLHPKTLQEAFWKAYAKWIFMKQHPLANIHSSDTCGLCNLYLQDNCNGCPIADMGHYGCSETPFDEWSDLRQKWDEAFPNNRTTYQDKIIKAIDKEIAFIQKVAQKYGLECE